MKELNIPIDVIGGTSAGSIVASQIALGNTLEEIIEQNNPHEFFDNPQHDRTKLFLSQILEH